VPGHRSVLAMDVPDDLELFARMCFLRHFEERTDALYRQGLIHGPVHLGLGQEAVAVGAASVLRPGDYSLGTYRGHTHALARGAPPDAVLAELLGRAGGICGGKGGSMHITSIEHGYYGSYAILGQARTVRSGTDLTLVACPSPSAPAWPPRMSWPDKA
jgi:acetoin:2,6-dichlorophenolindophenol oxidoreductase subunit alpha